MPLVKTTLSLYTCVILTILQCYHAPFADGSPVSQEGPCFFCITTIFTILPFMVVDVDLLILL